MNLEDILTVIVLTASIREGILFLGNKKKRKQFKKGMGKVKELLLTIGGSRYLKPFQFALLTVFVPLVLFLALIAYTILMARGELYQAITAFMLIAISGLLFAFFNYRLFQK